MPTDEQPPERQDVTVTPSMVEVDRHEVSLTFIASLVEQAKRQLRRADAALQRAGRRGRQRGSGAKWPGGIDGGGVPLFLDDLFTRLEKLQASTGRMWGHDPLSRSFRQGMTIYASDRTVRTYLAAAGLTPDDVKSGTLNRSNSSQFISERGA